MKQFKYSMQIQKASGSLPENQSPFALLLSPTTMIISFNSGLIYTQQASLLPSDCALPALQRARSSVLGISLSRER